MLVDEGFPFKKKDETTAHRYKLNRMSDVLLAVEKEHKYVTLKDADSGVKMVPVVNSTKMAPSSGHELQEMFREKKEMYVFDPAKRMWSWRVPCKGYIEFEKYVFTFTIEYNFFK